MEYNKTALIAGKLVDDTNGINSYNDKVIQKVRSLYLKRKIDEYEYGHLINILSCVSLKGDEMKGKLNNIIDREVCTPSIDVKV
ncbi:hypothetical protein CHH55_23585 [Niallia circulans]|uniref:hypothetical protein n=1 Tax=Niallia circulans TaxID=1397 RepID=UPI000BA5CAC5|nr:hypothetical protein [Niallia circulans]PAD85449.1 hypothetical protein CHH55_23585 [Niallia circulans]